MVAIVEQAADFQTRQHHRPVKVSEISIAEIVTTAGTQIRARIDIESVDQYAQAMLDGDVFPPVTVFHDGSEYILADGFHRVMAASRNGNETIQASVHKGTKSDALKFALSANSAHGLKRTNADKRRSVELALAEWPKLSTAEIARICAVSRPQVDAVRSEHADSACSRIGADGKERKLPKSPSVRHESSPVTAKAIKQAAADVAPEPDEPQPVPHEDGETRAYRVSLKLKTLADAAKEAVGSLNPSRAELIQAALTFKRLGNELERAAAELPE